MTSSTYLNFSAAFILILQLCLTFGPTMAQNEGDIRLVGMHSRSKGRVEVFYKKEWGTICDHNYGGAAHTICYQLNFLSPPSSHIGSSVKYLSKLLPTGSKVVLENVTDVVPIHFRDIDCGPIHSNPLSVIHLLRCNYVEIEKDSLCTHEDDLAVLCESQEGFRRKPYKSEVRLVKHGSNKNVNFTSRGILEIFLNSSWGNVCQSHFSESAAHTSCQQLGYTHAIDISWTDMRTADIVWLNKVNCGNKNYPCLNSCFGHHHVKNYTCRDNHYTVLNCSFAPSFAPKSPSGNPTKCMLTKKYHKVPAYLIGIISVVSSLWLVIVGAIIMITACFYIGNSSYRRNKRSGYVEVE